MGFLLIYDTRDGCESGVDLDWEECYLQLILAIPSLLFGYAVR